MFTGLTNQAKATIFYLIALALAFGVALMPGASTFVYMLTPLAAVLLMLLLVTRDGYSKAGWKSLGLHLLGLRSWGLAVAVPTLVMGVAFGIVWTTGIATFVIPDNIFGLGIPLWLLPLVLVLLLVSNTLTNSLGEELGWRGYLLPHLTGLAVWRAYLITGVLHAVWHFPVILLTTLYHPDGNRFVILPLFIMTSIMLGTFVGHLRLASGSVWPAALAHTAHNLMWAVFGECTVDASPVALEYLAGDTGILIAAGYGIFAAWLLFRPQRGTQPSLALGSPR